MTVVTIVGETRRQRKKAVVRARIIEAGIELFARHGIADVTVDQIAEAADIGKGTVYNYFQTKEDIVVAFMVDLERKVQAKLLVFTESKEPLDSVLAGFLRLQFRLKKRYHRFVRVFLAQMFLRTEEFVPYMLEMQKVIDPPLETLFRGLQQRGAIRTDVSLPELILIFKTIHLGLTALWAIEGPPFRQTERTLQQEVKLFCEGLKGTTS
ncbi:MAG: TetR/AcrR family transcriptional regulator [Bryobacteraceae bacterium]